MFNPYDYPDTLDLKQCDWHQAGTHEQHFNRIAEDLDDLIELRKDPRPKIQRVLEIQANLHQILDQVIRAIQEIIPGNVPQPSPTNDQHFEEFKCYRLDGLVDCIRGRLELNISDFLYASRKIIEELKLPGWKARPTTLKSRPYLDSAFDCTIKWLKGSELQIILDAWEDSSRSLDNVSADNTYFHLTHPAFAPPRSQAATQLVRSTTPIIKLPNLFFDKLSRYQRMGRKQLPSFTEMSSHQLYSLQISSEQFRSALSQLVSHLQEVDDDPPALDSYYVIRDIQSLSTCFRSLVPLVELYIAPLFPDVNGVSSQVYSKSWFITWNTLFFTATHNAIQAATVFAQNNHL
ncbi:uncharacterized protein PGTG_07908 [Puccinia graminis f. sp. tritici CRL 75-36-700-3]|uniref:Uncharacterized protein n=1 Tax=Puccinia graminis f. sp. tritici (strain CRL 75-36-700-3 / race SCCL) TaxID=418459 RepID=E3KBE6_PUCGT|nr:uncharacterized protein PGTG_07908 [Puccinia graminis f. sp. tritici CRL 75-36-700-3]EFP81659.2 hypothetical protein PGTG_07908 [Puccinia graminis f. sp. tritici CRL 75-36-700-3]